MWSGWSDFGRTNNWGEHGRTLTAALSQIFYRSTCVHVLTPGCTLAMRKRGRTDSKTDMPDRHVVRRVSTAETAS